MTYRVIMVHVDSESEGRVAIALKLAERFGAVLIGAAAIAVESSGSGDIASGEDTSEDGDIVGGEGGGPAQAKEFSAWLDRLGGRFRSLAGTKHEWRSALDYPTDFVIREASAADLLVIGADRPGDRTRFLDPGKTILGAGRPALLVPDNISVLAARRVLVAWKNEREARRAIDDAMPFLAEAQAVLLLHIDERRGGLRGESKLDDVAQYLARHEIHAEMRFEPQSEGSIGRDVARVAQEVGADLIVAGCLGRSRLSEFLFGGVTCDLLAQTALCCLLSH